MAHLCDDLTKVITKLQQMAPRELPDKYSPQQCFDLWTEIKGTEVQRLLAVINGYQSAYTAIFRHAGSLNQLCEKARINRYYRAYISGPKSQRVRWIAIYLLDELVNPLAKLGLTKFITDTIKATATAIAVQRAFINRTKLPKLVWQIFESHYELLEDSSHQLRELLERRLAFRLLTDDTEDLKAKQRIYTFLYAGPLVSKLIVTELINFRSQGHMTISDRLITL